MLLPSYEPSPEEIARACGEEEPSFICERVLEWTNGSEAWAEAADKLLHTPLMILLIIGVAFLANRLVRRAIRRLTSTLTDEQAQQRMRGLRDRAPKAIRSTGSYSLRAGARARTLSTVLRSIASALIWAIAVAMILAELGVHLGPLIAGAGIAGVAIGFGAQSLVKDFLAGIFMLVEDQYGVGDIIDAGDTTGTVEAITLRTTRLRDENGTVWHIPNGSFTRVGNLSQQWARALVDVEVAYGTDLDRASEVIRRVATGLWREQAWAGKVLEAPEIWGVERVEPEVVALRLVVKTRPASQFPVVRELRRRLADAFVDAGIAMRSPQNADWVRRDAGTSHEAPDTVEPPVTPG
ncbi:MAG TPA: mechanosensitive ion channel family protein [Acidimicrobiales bacterium]|nr:mechanosensitive ion channel family protein [Acidimicrobiales bacterium]